MIVQAGLIAVVAILSIGFSSVVIEQLLVREALDREAAHFWRNYEQNHRFPTPNTDNLKGYLVDSDSAIGLPEMLRGYPLGYHKVGGQAEHSLLYNSEHKGKRLILLFDGHSVFRLAVYFGVLPLTIVLVLIYVAAWWVYRESTHLTSPIVWLAHRFDNYDPAHPEATLHDLSDIPGDIDWEIDKLAHSLTSYSRRIKRLVDRERAFTRDASHEFRTPLTVIKMASDLLLSEQKLGPQTEKYLNRIRAATRDMEELIDAFLVLARETENEFQDETVVLRDLVEEEFDSAQIFLDQKDVNLEIDEQHPLQLRTSRKIVSIVLGNLIRNAVAYTDEGTITARIKENSVVIEDTGVGMSAQQLEKIFKPFYRAQSSQRRKRQGYGVGLAIVNRLCNQFNWQLEVASEPDQGTSVEITFADTD